MYALCCFGGANQFFSSVGRVSHRARVAKRARPPATKWCMFPVSRCALEASQSTRSVPAAYWYWVRRFFLFDDGSVRTKPNTEPNTKFRKGTLKGRKPCNKPRYENS